MNEDTLTNEKKTDERKQIYERENIMRTKHLVKKTDE